MNILDTKFHHHSWYLNCGLTKRQALEGMAETGDFRLDKKPSKNQSNNLFDEINYDDIICYCGKEKGTYKVTEEEKAFFIERSNFWREYHKQIPSYDEWKLQNGSSSYFNYLDWCNNEKMNIPEYADYETTFRNNSDYFKQHC